MRMQHGLLTEGRIGAEKRRLQLEPTAALWTRHSSRLAEMSGLIFIAPSGLTIFTSADHDLMLDRRLNRGYRMREFGLDNWFSLPPSHAKSRLSSYKGGNGNSTSRRFRNTPCPDKPGKTLVNLKYLRGADSFFLFSHSHT
jgi:hypothetical protein